MHGHIPPLLAEAARVLPLLPLEWAAQRLLANTLNARPSLLARLGDYAGRTFVLDPLDCPFVFVIAAGGRRPGLQVRRTAREVDHAARIGAPLLVLLGLLDGTYDGDALFFSRDLIIEGDTEAVLALRNAIENAELDAASVAGVPAGLAKPFNDLASGVLDTLRRTLGAPPPSGPRYSGRRA